MTDPTLSKKERLYQLWSLKEKMVYDPKNAKLIRKDDVYILASPSGELLVTRIR